MHDNSLQGVSREYVRSKTAIFNSLPLGRFRTPFANSPLAYIHFQLSNPLPRKETKTCRVSCLFVLFIEKIHQNTNDVIRIYLIVEKQFDIIVKAGLAEDIWKSDLPPFYLKYSCLHHPTLLLTLDYFIQVPMLSNEIKHTKKFIGVGWNSYHSFEADTFLQGSLNS